MRRSRAHGFAPIVLATLACLAPAAPALGAEGGSATVGAGGELFQVRAGSYGDLFPDQGLAAAGNTALALEIVRPDRPAELLLVPDTEGEDVEDSASVLFEDDSETLFVLWQTRVNTIHSQLNLIGYQNGAWTESIEISGNPFGWKSSPQLAVTRDSFESEAEDGTPRTWTRTVLHLVWWEKGSPGPQVLYTPVVLIDGEYTGWNPVYRLEDLALSEGTPLAAPHPVLGQAPRIEAGMNGQSVVIGFVPAAGGELVTVALELLPGEISSLAEKIRHQIIDVGRQVRDAEGPSGLGRKIRHQIIDVGARLKLHPGVSSYIAEQVYDRIVAQAPDRPMVAIAGEIRHQIIDVGAHVTDRGFDRLSAASVYQVVELPEGDRTDEAGVTAPPDLIRVIRASSRPVPRTDAATPHTLYLSDDGKGVVVSWSDGETLHYQESTASGWSDVRTLRLGSDLDLARAQALLERRADGRAASLSE